MKLEGSCHCGAVRFSVESHTPYPFMRCYCSICRKTAGGGGYAINVMGEAATLKVRGRGSVAVYRARVEGKGKRRSRSPGQRHFCAKCASALWVYDPRWPEWVYPFASAIDTALPKPPEDVEMMLDYAARKNRSRTGTASGVSPSPDDGAAAYLRKNQSRSDTTTEITRQVTIGKKKPPPSVSMRMSPGSRPNGSLASQGQKMPAASTARPRMISSRCMA
jgi:hypothetical protein